MRLGIQIGQEVMHSADHGILAGGQLVHLRVFQEKISLAHSALYLDDGVAHHAAEPCLGFGPVNNLLDGRIHQSAVKHCRIMAPATPFGSFGTRNLLHVLNALAIPLIVER